MARNCPRKQLVLTREANPIFFDAIKNEHLLRNGSRNKLHPEVMAKFVSFLQKQAKLTRKRTKSLDSANWTGSLSHVGTLRSANPKSGAYTKYGSVVSNIVNYVNRDEVDEDRTRTIKRTKKGRPRTPLPPPFPQERLPGLGIRTIYEPLPLAPLMQNMQRDMGMDMVDTAAPTLQFVVKPPRIAPPPHAYREHKETIKRI
jgi:hypothetical protein